MRGVRILKNGRKVSNKDWNSRACCPKCKVEMLDHEPMSSYGEYIHPNNDCVNAGYFMDRRPKSRFNNSNRKVEQFWRKRDRRAKNQSARQARKLRP